MPYILISKWGTDGLGMSASAGARIVSLKDVGEHKIPNMTDR